MAAKNPLAHIADEVRAARRDRLLIRNPSKRSRTEYLPPLLAFFDSQLPLIAVRGQGTSFLGFALALRNKRQAPKGSTPEQVAAFWLAERVKMEAQWGDPAMHRLLGIDPLSSEFLCWLNRKHPKLISKQIFLQDFRDNDLKIGEEVVRLHPDDGDPWFTMVVKKQIQPRSGKLMIEIIYKKWANQRKDKVPRCVTAPLSSLLQALSAEPLDVRSALEHYGATYDRSLNRRQQIVDVAAAVMAGSGGPGMPFEHDIALAHDTRTVIHNTADLQRLLPP